MDITTMEPVCCRNCGRLYHLRRQDDQNRQFWTANMVGTEGCHGPIAPETKRLKTTGLDFPHYCILHLPAEVA